MTSEKDGIVREGHLDDIPAGGGGSEDVYRGRGYGEPGGGGLRRTRVSVVVLHQRSRAAPDGDPVDVYCRSLKRMLSHAHKAKRLSMRLLLDLLWLKSIKPDSGI